MDNEMRMCINFGVAGFRKEEAHPDAYRKISALMQEFLACAQQYNCAKYGFSGEKIRCNIYSGDVFCTDEIFSMAKDNAFGMELITSAADRPDYADRADAVIALDINKRNLSYTNVLAEYMVNVSDAVFLLWDGEQNFQDGSLWTVMQLCKQKDIPYYLINTQDLESVSFASDAFFVPYSLENVKAYVAGLYDYPVVAAAPRKIFLSGLWLKLNRNFINKHKMKTANVPYEKDQILSKDYLPANHEYAKNHRMLVDYFEYYDQKATEASGLQRAAIYFRSILPFVATVFLAIGFYAETVLGFLLGKPVIFGMNAWTILAGIGFLIHAMLNLYAGQTAKNPAVGNLVKDFIEARFLAEHLRILIHSNVYGIQVDHIGMDDPLVEKQVLAKLHHIIRQQEPVSCVQDKKVMDEAASNFEALIQDQIAYHESCVHRYERIVERLSKAASTVYLAGVAVVILRGLLQFIIPFVVTGLNLSAAFHGIQADSFIKSSANMFALLLPAWASYFSTKLNMNNYAWLKENSVRMKNGFLAARKKLEGIQTRERNSYQIICDMANDILKLVREDCANWYFRTKSQKFTRL